MSQQGEKDLKQQESQNSLRNEQSTSLTNLDNQKLERSKNASNDSNFSFQRQEKEEQNQEYEKNLQMNTCRSLNENQIQQKNEVPLISNRLKSFQSQNVRIYHNILKKEASMKSQEKLKGEKRIFDQQNIKYPLKSKEQDQSQEHQNQIQENSILQQNIQKQKRKILKSEKKQKIKKLEENIQPQKSAQEEENKIITITQENQLIEVIQVQSQQDNKQIGQLQQELDSSVTLTQDRNQQIQNDQQQECQINQKEKQDSAQQVKNIAICIACSQYNKIYQNLECPKKDLELISNCLTQFNFEIIKCLDKSVSEIENELNKLKSQIQESKGYYNQIFFYYSGHGCIKKNDSDQNITIGLDSEAKHIELVKYAVELASLSNSVCFAFFDCCRVEIKGFKRIKQDYSNNLMLLFSCEENKESAGTSRGSISTLQFIQRIKKQDTQKISLSKQICVTEFLNKFEGEFYDNSKCDFILTSQDRYFYNTVKDQKSYLAKDINQSKSQKKELVKASLEQ